MKLHVIVKLERLEDVRQLRDKLCCYGIDFTDLLSLALESWEMEDPDSNVWDFPPSLVSLLDPRHRVNRMILNGRIDFLQHVQLNAWLQDAIAPLQTELQRLLLPFVEPRFAQQAVTYRLKRYLHRCDGLIVEVSPRQV